MKTFVSATLDGYVLVVICYVNCVLLGLLCKVGLLFPFSTSSLTSLFPLHLFFLLLFLLVVLLLVNALFNWRIHSSRHLYLLDPTTITIPILSTLPSQVYIVHSPIYSKLIFIL